MKNNIRKMRLDLHHTQEEVARNTNIHQSTISKLERGLQDPSCEQIQILSQYFKTSTDYLYGLQDKPFISRQKSSFQEENSYSYMDENQWKEKIHLLLIQEIKSPEFQKEMRNLILSQTDTDH